MSASELKSAQFGLKNLVLAIERLCAIQFPGGARIHTSSHYVSHAGDKLVNCEFLLQLGFLRTAISADEWIVWQVDLLSRFPASGINYRDLLLNSESVTSAWFPEC